MPHIVEIKMDGNCTCCSTPEVKTLLLKSTYANDNRIILNIEDREISISGRYLISAIKTLLDI